MQLHCCDSNLVISYSYYFELKQFPWICLSVILVTGISYFKLLLFRTIFDFEFIVGEPSTHHLPRLALLFAGGVIFVYLNVRNKDVVVVVVKIL